VSDTILNAIQPPAIEFSPEPLVARLRELFSRNSIVPFSSFNNHFAGRACWVVGRGPTSFDYAKLSDVHDPVFFINDAVSLEKHVRAESFFFAHDEPQEVWLRRRLKSTAVLPVGGKLWQKLESAQFDHTGAVALYSWEGADGEQLLAMSRDEVAAAQQLYRHTGTMHSLLHFIWFCGFQRVNFVGCDGINDAWQLHAIDAPAGYDRRIENLSSTSPWWQYSEIRRVQDRLCERFGFETKYLGTPNVSAPPRPGHERKIPALAHFTWLGGPIPKMVRENIEQFRALHPTWDVRLWIGVPPGMPDDFVAALYRTRELCMRADIIRLWLLHEFGGVYLDGDMHVLRSIEELRGYDHFAGFRVHGTINNAVLGAAPGSEAVRLLIDEMRQSFTPSANETRRTMFGPDLLARVKSRSPAALNILPAHYFYIFNTQGSAIRFIRAEPERRREMIEAVRDRITDDVEPFAIHTWGIPKEEMPACYGSQSSWVAPLPVGDAVLRRVPNVAQRACEVGARDGRLTAYWLGHNPQLTLMCVATADAASAIRELTDFASERLTVADGMHVNHVADDSLDWIFLHGSADAEAWLPKLRRGGLLASSAPFTALHCDDVEHDEAGVWFLRRK
jgi:hypothetical protein